jgi:zinc/manganese transport system permease protein
VATAAALLLADRAPRGAEAIREILVGSIIWVTWPTILKHLALPYAILGVFHYLLRHRFLTISFHPEEAERQGWNVRWWDFLFYLSFGVVIIFSVPIGGVLMVFTFLVVPAAIAFLFTRDMRRLAGISWVSGALASLAGLGLSYRFDMPTGPMIVCTYAALLVLAGLARRFVRTTA